MRIEFTIQQVAEPTRESIHALRYYEKVGLLAAIQEASNGHPRYSAEDVAWLQFLNRLRAGGMLIQKVLGFADLVCHHPNEIGERGLLV